MAGLDELTPVRMSLTRAVPAAVPSDFHSSTPDVPSAALKKRVLPAAVRLRGEPPFWPNYVPPG
jgi:hypothetical protein